MRGAVTTLVYLYVTLNMLLACDQRSDDEHTCKDGIGPGRDTLAVSL